MKNTGGRWGGAITAAVFLHVFAEETPWIHLDIAGLAWVEDSASLYRQGPQRHRRPLDLGMGPQLFGVTPRVALLWVPQVSLLRPGQGSQSLGPIPPGKRAVPGQIAFPYAILIDVCARFA